MALTKLVFRPGINRETTAYANEGGWWDGNLVRFSAGRPESIGGWTRFTTTPTLGTTRALISWTLLDGTNVVGLGTNLKYYVVRGSALNDITPLRDTTPAGAVTFAATNGSPVITVSDTAHGALAGDFVTFSGAVSLGGNITATLLNAEHQITQVVDGNTYRITLGVNANASDSGNGGASVIGTFAALAELQLPINVVGIVVSSERVFDVLADCAAIGVRFLTQIMRQLPSLGFVNPHQGRFNQQASVHAKRQSDLHGFHGVVAAIGVA